MNFLLNSTEISRRPSDKEHQEECDENRRALYQEMDEELDLTLTGISESPKLTLKAITSF